MKKRDTFKYQVRVGRKIVHGGITKDPERRQEEHRDEWPNAKLTTVGRRTTEEGARKWEEEKGYT